MEGSIQEGSIDPQSGEDVAESQASSRKRRLMQVAKPDMSAKMPMTPVEPGSDLKRRKQAAKVANRTVEKEDVSKARSSKQPR